jgi:hypothetical protein
MRLYRLRSKTNTSTWLLVSSRLFQYTVNLILIFQLQHLGGLISLNAFPIQQKAKTSYLYTLALRVSLKDLGHLSRLLDLEERLFARL